MGLTSSSVLSSGVESAVDAELVASTVSRVVTVVVMAKAVVNVVTAVDTLFVNPNQDQYQIGVHRSNISTQLDDIG